MGRKWANIKGKKTTKDANNSRVYAKFGIEIYAAAKSGDPGPHANRRLRFVIERVETYNVPKHITNRAIEEAKGSAGEQYSKLRYKGFGPNGLMVIIDALTNNVNRAAADVRVTFSESDGNTGVSSAVSYMFDNTDIVDFVGDDADEILKYSMKKDIDVRDVVEEDGQITVYTEPGNFHHIQEVSEERGIKEFTVTESKMVPRNEVTLEGDDLGSFEKMLDVLKDLEDAQKAHHSVDLPKRPIYSFI